MSNVEKVLYSYFADLAKIERLKRDIARLISVHGAQMELNVGNVIVDPVARRMDDVERMEKELGELKERVRPVTQLVRDLPDELLYLLDGHYFRKKGWGMLWRRKGWSRITGGRRKKELLRLAEEYVSAS